MAGYVNNDCFPKLGYFNMQNTVKSVNNPHFLALENIKIFSLFNTGKIPTFI